MKSTEHIYHYTSAESLALILKSKKLRFTRVDRVDDVLEAQSLAGIQFGKYVFASCWTEEAEESLPQWHMYSGGMTGVRIQLPRNPFRSLTYMLPSDFMGIEINGPMESPITFEEGLGSNYYVAPLFFDNHFASPVEYVKDVRRCYEKHVTTEDEHGGNPQVTVFDAGRLIRYKSEVWSFQQEYRFALTILPTHPSELIVGSSPVPERPSLRYAPAAYLAGVDHGLQFFDVPISEYALDSLVVRTGPLCAPGTIACIDAVLSQWAPKAKLEQSALAGTMRVRR